MVVGLEINADETKFRFMSRHQNVGQDHIKITENTSKPFDNTAKFKHFGTVVTHYEGHYYLLGCDAV
jgi:hypothetical protein